MVLIVSVPKKDDDIHQQTVENQQLLSCAHSQSNSTNNQNGQLAVCQRSELAWLVIFLVVWNLIIRI